MDGLTHARCSHCTDPSLEGERINFTFWWTEQHLTSELFANVRAEFVWSGNLKVGERHFGQPFGDVVPLLALLGTLVFWQLSGWLVLICVGDDGH